LPIQPSPNKITSKRVELFFLFVALIFISLIYFYHKSDVVLGDADTWWHIKTGQDIISNLSVPITDSYSYTFSGHPWIAKEWLSQVLFAIAYNAAGWSGVFMITIFAAGLAMALLYLEIVKKLNPIFAAVTIMAISAVINPIIIARPHIFTFAIAIFFTCRLFRSAETQKSPEFWLLALITLWANLHGSFTLAFMIAGFSFLCAMEQSRFLDRALMGKWAVFLLLCPVAALLNPYGFQPFLINLGLISGIQAMTLISEWQPLNAQKDIILVIGMFLVIGILFASGARLALSKILFLLFTMYMMLSHIRFMSIFFLLVPIVVVTEIVPQVSKLSRDHWNRQPRDNFEIFVASKFLPIISMATIVVFCLFLLSAKHSQIRPSNDLVNQGAFAYLNNYHMEGPVLNSYEYGGPLILNNIKTFIDSRADQLFLGDFFRNYIDSSSVGGEKALASILQTNKITWTFLAASDRRNQFLAAMPNWKKTYADEYTVIFERN
jgi:hypothetical protein